MNREQLEEIRARVAKAIEGPWEADGWEVYGPAHRWVAETHDPDNVEQCEADASFIAAARTDVPALLEEIDRQISTLHAVLMGAAEDYRQCIVAARASMSDADYQRCNGRAEAYRQAATRLAESSGLPIPDWDRIRREVPADGVYRQATPAAAAEGGTSKDSHEGGPTLVCGCGVAPDAVPGAAGCSPSCMTPEPDDFDVPTEGGAHP